MKHLYQGMSLLPACVEAGLENSLIGHEKGEAWLLL